GVEHIDVKQTLSGGFKAPADIQLLNGEESPRNHDLLGHLIAKSWRSKVDDLDIDFLKEGWSEDILEDGLIARVVKSDTAKSGKDWVVNEVWGFVVIDGVRRFARRYKFTTKNRSEPIYVKLYYDYGGYLAFSYFLMLTELSLSGVSPHGHGSNCACTMCIMNV
ncbi:hypothetical protein BDR05DRAFT_869788, partial [Suillus weaverae]